MASGTMVLGRLLILIITVVHIGLAAGEATGL